MARLDPADLTELIERILDAGCHGVWQSALGVLLTPVGAPAAGEATNAEVAAAIGELNRQVVPPGEDPPLAVVLEALRVVTTDLELHDAIERSLAILRRPDARADQAPPAPAGAGAPPQLAAASASPSVLAPAFTDLAAESPQVAPGPPATGWDYSGRLWTEHGRTHIAVVRVTDGDGGVSRVLANTRIDTLIDFVVSRREHYRTRCGVLGHVKWEQVVLVSGELRALIDVLADVYATLDPEATWLRTGIAHGYVAEWPTPLLREDIVGGGVTDAFRCANASVAAGHGFVVSDAIHAALLAASVDPTSFVATTYGKAPHQRTGHGTGPATLRSLARALEPQPTPGLPSARTDTPSRAFVVVVDLKGSESVGANHKRQQAMLATLRSVTTAHVPALTAHVDLRNRDVTNHADFINFEFTGDGFELVVFTADATTAPVTATDLSLLDWLYTFALDVFLRTPALPLRIAAAAGMVSLRKTPGGHRRVYGEALEHARRGCSARPNEVTPCVRLHESVCTSTADLDRDYPYRDVAATDPKAPRPALPDLAALFQKGVGDFRPFRDGHMWSETDAEPRHPLGHNKLHRPLRHWRNYGLAHALLESVITMCVGVAIFGWPRDDAAEVKVAFLTISVAIGFAVAGAAVFGWYARARVLPTLHRFHYKPRYREHAERSCIRLLDALNQPSLRARLAGVYRECGFLGIVFWARWWSRIWRRKDNEVGLPSDLPGPTVEAPALLLAVAGAVAYAVWSAVITETWYAPGGDLLDFRWSTRDGRLIAVASAMGAVWAVLLFLRLRQINLGVLYLSNRGLRDVSDKLARGGRWYRNINIALRAAVIALLGGLLGWGYARGEERAMGCALVALGLLLLLSVAGRVLVGSTSKYADLWFEDLLARPGGRGGDDRGRARDEDTLSIDSLTAAMRVMTHHEKTMRAAAEQMAMLTRQGKVAGRVLTEADRRGLSWYVTDQHGFVLLATGPVFSELGWKQDPPQLVWMIYGEGRYATRVVRDLIRNGEGKLVVEVEMLAAGPLKRKSASLEVQPVRLFVHLLNPWDAVGYLGVIVPLGEPRETAAFFRKRTPAA